MAVPGAGLLALLRKRNEAQAPPPPLPLPVALAAEPTAVAAASSSSSKFEARSSAVHALEHAVATGTGGDTARTVMAQGRRIPPGPAYIYDVDFQAPGEAQPQLPVTPVTLIATEYALHHYHQNAASGDYICYGLKQGHIRVLSRHSALRALLKGHSKPLTDLQFAAGHGGSLLASGGQDGKLFVWQLQLDDDAASIHDTRKLEAHFTSGSGSAGEVYLSWHSSARFLAVGVGNKVLLVTVPSHGMEQLEFDIAEGSTPDVTVLSEWEDEPVSSLCFSPDGQLLAVGGVNGTVRVWELQSAAAEANGSGPLQVVHSTIICTTDGCVGSVRWLPTPAARGLVLLTGNHNNSQLRLWRNAGAAGSSSWEQLQALEFQGKDGQKDFFNHVEVVPTQQLVVLADTVHKAVYTFHFSGDFIGNAGTFEGVRFDYVSRFGVAVPILSFDALWNPAGGEQHDMPIVELTCVQTTAIQQYSLDPRLCYDGDAVEEAEEEQAADDSTVVNRTSPLERHGRDLSIQAQPSTAVPMPSEDLATPRQAAAAAAASLPSELQGGMAASDDVAAEQPTSTGSPAEAELSLAELAAGNAAASLVAPSPVARQAEPQYPRGPSGEVTPEECPSPPPTPTEQQLIQQAAAAADAAEAPEAAAPAAAASHAAGLPPPPRLLTPSDLLQSSSTSTLSEDGNGQLSAPLGVQAQPPRSILQRASSSSSAGMPSVIPVTLASPAPAPAAHSEAAEPEEAEQPALPTSAAAPAAPITGIVADEAALAAAVAEAMGGVHKKFVGHVSLMYRELLKAMKSEMSAQAAAQQQATAQLLAAALEEQKRQIEAERAAVLAEERGNIERLLTAISATLNRDLPTRLQEAVHGELAGIADSVSASMAAAVQQGLAASLPKELTGAMKAGLDKQLGPVVAAGLNKPLQEAFRTAFSKQLVPSFEAATQSMFQQINTAFSAGFDEHLQASKAALSEPAKLASQLAQSLASVETLAASLSEGQQNLLRAQSLNAATTVPHSPAAPVDVKAELASLLRAHKYEKAFSQALSLQDVATVGWLVIQADAASVLGQNPCPLSQMVLLSLVQQLSADLTTNLSSKLTWIREAAMLIDPQDPVLARHLRPVLESVYAALQAAAGRIQGAEASSCRLAMHVVHSQMTT